MKKNDSSQDLFRENNNSHRRSTCVKQSNLNEKWELAEAFRKQVGYVREKQQKLEVVNRVCVWGEGGGKEMSRERRGERRVE